MGMSTGILSGRDECFHQIIKSDLGPKKIKNHSFKIYILQGDHFEIKYNGAPLYVNDLKRFHNTLQPKLIFMYTLLLS